MKALLKDVFERMIGVKRPHEGYGEGAALAWLHREVVPKSAVTWIDGAGNLHIDLREDAGNRTLFVAHVDTMHRVEGTNGYTVTDKGFYMAQGAPLGADDGAGIAILSVLMQSIPAYYLICRGEEQSGVGSKYIAKEYPDLLKQFDRAVAFDRRGYSDVITHQFRGRCASEAFAEALSDQLNDQGLLYMPCDGGVYTDTAEFVDLIPECTNISCGYDFEHSDREQQDGNYLNDLCIAALNIDWDSLPVVRDPGDDGYSNEPLGGTEMYSDDLFPVAQTPDELDIEDATYAALDSYPEELMDIVGKRVSTSGWRLDESLFQPNEVLAILSYCHTWEEFLEALADESSLMVN